MYKIWWSANFVKDNELYKQYAIEEQVYYKEKERDDKLYNEKRKKQNEERREILAKEKQYRKLAKEKEENERENWIKNNGDEYLKELYEQGYDYYDYYIHQRCNKEFPEFICISENQMIDEYNDTLSEDEICEEYDTPSMNALLENKAFIEEGIDSEIVYLLREIDKNSNIGDEIDYSYYNEVKAEYIKINYLDCLLLKKVDHENFNL